MYLGDPQKKLPKVKIGMLFVYAELLEKSDLVKIAVAIAAAAAVMTAECDVAKPRTK